MEGCPGHRIRLASKHGGYYVEYLNEQGELLGNNGGRVDIGDICLFDAVVSILAQESDKA